jgi:hypothetical protein
LTVGTWNANVIGNAYTTANSANGASTIVARDSNGNFTANAGTFTSVSGNGVALTAINASNVSSGTLDNARTTANSANGASTIVARDSNGSFSGNVITGTTGTFTNISGNGVALTAINASNVTSGTLDNARTTAATANGASTIVLRGSSGEFTAGAITGASFTGSGTGISAINASNISSGTIANARTTASDANGASTIVARDASGNFTANAGTFTSVSGNGVALTAINASNIASGTIANARTTASDANGASTIVSRSASGSFAGNIITVAAGSNSAPSITTASDDNTGIYFPAADSVGFAEGGTGYKVGYRNVPQSGSDKTSSYTLATSDIGEFVGVGASGSITIPNSTFSAGDVISVFNNTTANVTITCSITTAYISGVNTDKDTMVLATRGLATILFISGTVCVVTGNVS